MSEVPLYTNQEDHMFLLVAIFLIHILSYNTLTITSGLDLKKTLYIMIEKYFNYSYQGDNSNRL